MPISSSKNQLKDSRQKMLIAVQVSPDRKGLRGVLSNMLPLQFTQRRSMKQIVGAGIMATATRHRVFGQRISREGGIESLYGLFQNLRTTHILIFTQALADAWVRPHSCAAMGAPVTSWEESA